MTLPEGLAAASFDRAEQTFFTWLGVVPFLTEDAAFRCASGEPAARALGCVKWRVTSLAASSWIPSRPFLRPPPNLAGARGALAARLNF
jgi:hypothetical protein